MKKTIIFDISISGHHLEYIIHLFRFLETQKPSIYCQYYFVVNPMFIEIVKNHFDVEFMDKLNIIQIQNSELKKIEDNTKVKTTFLQSYRALLLLKKYADKLNVRKCVVLNLDLIFKGLTIFKLFNIEIIGIWFHPHVRIPSDRLISKLLKFAKYIFLKNVLIINNIKTIFILNDSVATIALNKMTKSGIFKFLPDPINILPKGVVNADIELSKHDKNKTVFLLFGDISERKGALLLLDLIINHLTPATLNRIQFLIVGKINYEIRNLFYKNIDYINETKNFYPIIIDRFVEYSEIPNIFSLSDCILMPYVNFYGSSGILNYAAYFGKPVITGEHGLVSEIVQEYDLGYITPLNPKSLSVLITQFRKNELKNNYSIKSKNYIDTHKPEIFATHILFSSVY